MNPTTLRERALGATIAGAVPLLRAVTFGAGKVARGVRARAGAADRLIAWRRAHAQPGRPLVWVHAPSVGEALMAKAIIGALRLRVSDAQIVFTSFSPSAERVAGAVGADVTDFLPWDTEAEVGRAVRALRPAVVACVRTEVWPLLARATQRSGGAVALLNAVLSESSGRLRDPARWLLTPTYARLDAVGIVSTDDEQRFRRMGVAPDRIRFTGDARFDQVWQRVTALRADTERLARLRALVPADRPIVVAGSTWPEDERLLLEAMRALARERPAPLWVIAPHEPTPGHVRALGALIAAGGLDSTTMGDAEAGHAVTDALVVDRIGVLADLYAIAHVAYVGGGFHDQGLHSVVEPAALGVPVMFGPRLGNAREAAELSRGGGGVQVDGREHMIGAFRSLLTEPRQRASAGEAARTFVEERLGAADRNAALIRDLIETRAPGAGTD